MLIIRNVLFLFFVSFPAILFAQIGGQSVYPFLNLAISPRQLALGGKNITIFDQDVNQGAINPASINVEMDNQLAVNYTNLYGELNYGTANYAYVWDRRTQTIHAGIQYMSYGTFDGRDELGNATGSFSANEAALSVGYGYNIPFSDFYIGVNGKLITSQLESYTSIGAALDLGIIYKDDDNDIIYSLLVRNFGTQISTYAGLKERLPFELLAGISQELQYVPLRWHITLENLQQWDLSFSNPARAENTLDGGVKDEEVSFINNTMRHVVIGAELFPRKGFNIRLGYNFRRSQELSITDVRTFSGLSVGLGLKFGRFKFDYAYARFTAAAHVSMFGLTLNLE
jgi:hypothetical protein